MQKTCDCMRQPRPLPASQPSRQHLRTWATVTAPSATPGATSRTVLPTALATALAASAAAWPAAAATSAAPSAILLAPEAAVGPSSAPASAALPAWPVGWTAGCASLSCTDGCNRAPACRGCRGQHGSGLGPCTSWLLRPRNPMCSQLCTVPPQPPTHRRLALARHAALQHRCLHLGPLLRGWCKCERVMMI